MADRMSLQFFKYPNVAHWRHENLVVLGEDEHGLWLGCEPGSEQQKGSGPITTTQQPWVFCSVPDAWWSLVFNGEHRITHFLDIITPPTIKGDRIEMIDLDLDVVRKATGEVYVDDEDEFLVHQKLYGYPPWMIDKARTTTAELAIALEDHREPFNRVCQTWFDGFANRV